MPPLKTLQRQHSFITNMRVESHPGREMKPYQIVMVFQAPKTPFLSDLFEYKPIITRFRDGGHPCDAVIIRGMKNP